MDEDSILFQAMRDEMSPAYQGFDPAAMKIIPPGDPYRTGVEIMMPPRGGPRGGLGSAQQPTDFAGRPAHANQNPINQNPSSPFSHQGKARPAENVINQYERDFASRKQINEFNREYERYQQLAREPWPTGNAPPGADAGYTRRMLWQLREFFNKNRDPSSWAGRWLD